MLGMLQQPAVPQVDGDAGRAERGSTRWALANIKDTVEDNRTLDISRMSRDGWLRRGCRGTLEWTRNSEPFDRLDSEEKSAERHQQQSLPEPRRRVPDRARHHQQHQPDRRHEYVLEQCGPARGDSLDLALPAFRTEPNTRVMSLLSWCSGGFATSSVYGI